MVPPPAPRLAPACRALYVFGGVLPAGVAALVVGASTPFGPVARASNLLLAVVTLEPQLETTFQGDEQLLTWTVAGLTTWLGWTLPLIAAELWLERDRRAATLHAPESKLPRAAKSDAPTR